MMCNQYTIRHPGLLPRRLAELDRADRGAGPLARHGGGEARCPGQGGRGGRAHQGREGHCGLTWFAAVRSGVQLGSPLGGVARQGWRALFGSRQFESLSAFIFSGCVLSLGDNCIRLHCVVQTGIERDDWRRDVGQIEGARSRCDAAAGEPSSTAAACGTSSGLWTFLQSRGRPRPQTRVR